MTAVRILGMTYFVSDWDCIDGKIEIQTFVARLRGYARVFIQYGPQERFDEIVAALADVLPDPHPLAAQQGNDHAPVVNGRGILLPIAITNLIVEWGQNESLKDMPLLDYIRTAFPPQTPP